MTESLIPKQYIGRMTDAVAQNNFDTVEEAKAHYEIAKKRLLAVNNWFEISKLPASTFTLTDSKGNKISRNLMEGDYMRINIPGPGISTGNGYDWVCFDAVVELEDAHGSIISITAHPSKNPETNSDAIAHFYEERTSSTLQVKRLGKCVSAEMHGRNEVSNTHTNNIMDNIRNFIVGVTAKFGGSYPQWKSLVAGLVEK